MSNNGDSWQTKTEGESYRATKISHWQMTIFSLTIRGSSDFVRMVIRCLFTEKQNSPWTLHGSVATRKTHGKSLSHSRLPFERSTDRTGTRLRMDSDIRNAAASHSIRHAVVRNMRMSNQSERRFSREVHDLICDSFHTFFPKPLMEIDPKTATADEFFHRGNVRSIRGQYDEPSTVSQKRTNARDCDAIEFAMAQWYLQYGKTSWWRSHGLIRRFRMLKQLTTCGNVLPSTWGSLMYWLEAIRRGGQSLQMCTGVFVILLRGSIEGCEASLGKGTIFAEASNKSEWKQLKCQNAYCPW